jgi:hypothetical protein
VERKVPATSPDQRKDTVAAVRPHGLVERGRTITLDVWEEYKPPRPDNGGGGHADWYDGKPPKEPKGWGIGKGHDH